LHNGSRLLDGTDEIFAVLSAVLLPDGSWEIVVVKAFLAAFVEYFGKRFRGSHINLTYNPFESATDELLRDE